MASAIKSALPTHLMPGSASGNGDESEFTGKHHGKTRSHMAFENTSTNIAAAQMRNALTSLSETVKDPEEKKVSRHDSRRDKVRFGDAPLIKLGSDFKKVSDFQKHIPSIPRIIELDHLTITGAVNLGRGVTLKGTVIIVATEGSTIDIPPGSILENVVVQGSLRLLEH
ncbi:UTP-glucose-1-phosphate uridylyltransferase [Diaporthe helianthi]|uniref:UTP--glucose-1-phosphate uridylyltransferase n=1 Tax=Diaporthe helianthi TaxID=158607 RepID=A0A2P5HNG3_DIAHE|nr:UTP-glucose-1-phosphate uridylyltransferase [Diaporthe helianthi]